MVIFLFDILHFWFSFVNSFRNCFLNGLAKKFLIQQMICFIFNWSIICSLGYHLSITQKSLTIIGWKSPVKSCLQISSVREESYAQRKWTILCYVMIIYDSILLLQRRSHRLYLQKHHLNCWSNLFQKVYSFWSFTRK